MKYNEIATPRPLQFLMVRARNDKKGFGQHALNIQHFPLLSAQHYDTEAAIHYPE
jgi:hypothetical protein